MQFNPLPIPGCYEILPFAAEDARGVFVKIFHAGVFRKMGLEDDFKEEYFSWSRRGVLRGLHFQAPPRHCAKLVLCLEGHVLDAVVDLRVGSPAYGRPLTLELYSKKLNMLYLPSGVAHGFYVRSARALMLYKVSAVHAPRLDAGIHWDSVGVRWPVPSPVLSARDRSLPALKDFKSPFVFRGKR